jgi:5,10-methylenetetrahydromethanopterin reductase
MSYELLMLGNQPMARMGEVARLAERTGYDTVWLADERFYREVYGGLAYLAGQTRRVKLGPCVTDPYSRHPALTAMAIATLDEISGGRAVLGVGAGISGFGELGIERVKPAKAIREAIELIRRLLAGETVTCQGEVVSFREGRLSFKPVRPEIPVVVATNGPLGKKMAGAVADAVIMEAAANVEEIKALRAEISAGAKAAGRDPASVRLVARLNTCIGADGAAARDALRPTVARLLGAQRLKFTTAERQGLTLPEEAVASVKGAAYASGVSPYLPLLPLVTDRHVNAFTLAGTAAEVAAQVAELRGAGADSIIIMPFAAPGGSIEATIEAFGTEVWPKVAAMEGAPA